MKSKEQSILELFFNNPAKEWHFEDILKHTKLSRSKADKWLKVLVKSHIVKKVKPKAKMPYYTSNYEDPNYQNKKTIYALNALYDSGFLNHLKSLPKAETVILFGSYSRWDWHSESDIDLFVYGDSEGLEIEKYEARLKRNIQLFACKNEAELKKFGPELLRNILRGNVIKGYVPKEIFANAGI